MTNYIDIQYYISDFARYHNREYCAFLMIFY